MLQAQISVDHAGLAGNKSVARITTIGRDGPTLAEAQRVAKILRILQGSEDVLSENPWIQNIWFPSGDDHILCWPETWSTSSSLPSRSTPPVVAPSSNGNPVRHPLNQSQQTAVDTMLSPSNKDHIVVIQGPPGTGKTSVIARFVQTAIDAGQTGLWLVAQSNVAVKNIAEKLTNVGFLDWRLLVSKDFHFDWLLPFSSPQLMHS